MAVAVGTKGVTAGLLDERSMMHGIDLAGWYVAEAFEYRESLRMSDDDAEFVERVFEEAEADSPEVVED